MDNSILSFLAFGAVLVGGIGGILGGVSIVLHAIAPRTKTTVDDELAAGVDAAHDKLDQVLDLLHGIEPASSAPSSTSTASAAAVPARNPQSGRVSLGVLIAAALPVLMAVAIGIIVSACHTLGPAAANGLVAAIDCEAQHFTTQVVVDATHFADSKIDQLLADADAPSPEALEADLKPFDTDAKRCALLGLVTSATSAASAGSGAGSGSPVATLSARSSVAPTTSSVAGDPVQVRAAVSAAARKLGWAPRKLAGGTVL